KITVITFFSNPLCIDFLIFPYTGNNNIKRNRPPGRNKGEEPMNLKSGLFPKENNYEARIYHDEKKAAYKIALELVSILPANIKNRPIVFICIGTDRSTGDSLGPLIG